MKVLAYERQTPKKAAMRKLVESLVSLLARIRRVVMRQRR
jgi:hypothetical protein